VAGNGCGKGGGGGRGVLVMHGRCSCHANMNAYTPALINVKNRN
jgi:hypothetical protein